jgi:hypothetical protein
MCELCWRGVARGAYTRSDSQGAFRRQHSWTGCALVDDRSLLTTTSLNDLPAQDLRYRLVAHLGPGGGPSRHPTDTSATKITTPAKSHRTRRRTSAATSRSSTCRHSSCTGRRSDRPLEVGGKASAARSSRGQRSRSVPAPLTASPIRTRSNWTRTYSRCARRSRRLDVPRDLGRDRVDGRRRRWRFAKPPV